MRERDLTILVGQLPPPIHGLSVSFELVVNAFRYRGLAFEVINLASQDLGRQVGKFSFFRSVEVLRVLLSHLSIFIRAQNVYLTVGLSRSAFIRDFLIIWYAYFMKCRITIHVHSGGYKDFFNEQPLLLQTIIKSTLTRVDAIVVLGELMRKQFDFLPQANRLLKVVFNGRPADTCSRDVCRKQLEPSEPIRLLYLSNMLKSKGYLDVLEACRILRKEKEIPITCDFCGDFQLHVFQKDQTPTNNAREKFQTQIEKYDLLNIVRYHGVISGEDKRKILTSAHLFLLPTYYSWEGQPISIIEAMAFGLPVIATAYRGIPEQVIDGYNGFLVDPSSPVQIADAVEKLYKDPELYQQFSVNSLHHYQKNFTAEAHLNKLIPIILGNEESHATQHSGAK